MPWHVDDRRSIDHFIGHQQRCPSCARGAGATTDWRARHNGEARGCGADALLGGRGDVPPSGSASRLGPGYGGAASRASTRRAASEQGGRGAVVYAPGFSTAGEPFWQRTPAVALRRGRTAIPGRRATFFAFWAATCSADCHGCYASRSPFWPLGTSTRISCRMCPRGWRFAAKRSCSSATFRSISAGRPFWPASTAC
jgi:hypothetical protein